jgi:hypothetical protein
MVSNIYSSMVFDIGVDIKTGASSASFFHYTANGERGGEL